MALSKTALIDNFKKTDDFKKADNVKKNGLFQKIVSSEFTIKTPVKNWGCIF